MFFKYHKYPTFTISAYFIDILLYSYTITYTILPYYTIIVLL